MKLAKAAAQKLKGVIIEYDVLCSTLIGKSATEQAEQKRRKLAAAAEKQKQEQSSFGAGLASVSNMFVNDVRSLLKDLHQDSTGKPWVVKDRLQSVMQGLPSQYIDKMTGDPEKERAAAGKSEDDIHLEKQLASASEELARMREQKEAARKEQERNRLEKTLGGGSGSSDGNAARAKYLDKINQLKAKAKDRTTTGAPTGVLDLMAGDNSDLTSKGLSTWLVNDGANELLSYSNTRGLFKAVIPNQSPIQNDEYEYFLKEMDGQFDAFMSRDAYHKFPDPAPILSICGELGLEPADVLVIGRSSATIKAAKAAGTHACHFQFSPSDLPNHNAHYRLTNLKDFQFLIEDFNGISYRGKTPLIMWREGAARRSTDMAYNYVATAQKPTSVTHSLTAAFTGANDVNLLLAKSTRFEVHLLTPEGLFPQHDINLYGRIAIFEVFRAANEPQDWLFIVTQRFQFCVLAYDAATQQVVTKAHGNIRDSIGRSSEIVTTGNIDPEGRLIGMNLYEGYFKVIPIDNNKGILKETFNIRLDELRVIDIKFLHGYTKPTICVLYEDYKAARHVKTYHILVKEKDFAEGPWSQSNVEAGASLLVPVPAPCGGVLIVSNQTIVYHNGTSFHAIPMQSTVIQVYGSVDKDGSRFLLADQYGTLSVVALQFTGKDVTGVHLEVLGETSIASCISYLDNGVVFVGSTFGDSQLIKLNPERDEQGSYIEVLDTYVNVGPIIDFCVMDLDRQGQGQIVTCSGADKDGSLRVIRNGIGINEQASTELPGIKGMWSLRETFASEHDKYLLQSYVSEIRILAIGDDDEMEEKEIDAFLNVKTLYCRNLLGNAWLQVTEGEMRVISSESFQLASTWTPPAGSRITVAAANPTQVVAATSGGVLVYLEVHGDKLVEQSQVRLEHEIACVDMTPFTSSTRVGQAANGDGDVKMESSFGQHWELNALRSPICVVGLWTNFSVCVLELPTLKQLTKEPLGNDLLPRSVLCNTFEGEDYLLVGLGDGSLVNFHLDAATGALSNRKRVSLGSQPIALSTFRSKDMTHVFASCDRPTVIYSNNNKLLYSNVNAKEVNVMCPFDSESFPECLALASEEELTIGTVDDIQKLHIQTFHLNEWARRIAHNGQSHTLGVLTVNFSVDDNGDEVDQGFVRLIDDQTFEILNSYRLDPFETPCSIIVTPLTGDASNASYFIVGTAYVHQEESEPHQGRILVFSVTGIHGERKLQLVTEKEVKGAVYCLNAFNGKVLAGVNSKVHLYKWSENADNEKELISECGHYGHTLALFMESRGDFIVVGDLMKSISLLSYKQLDGTIEEIAKDLNSNWMTALGIVDDDTYIGSETDFNLFTVQRNSGAVSDEERGRLETVGEYHLGEFVNRFRYGSLVMQNNTASTINSSSSSDMVDVGQPSTVLTTPANHQSMLFGTVSGMIGVIVPITKDQYGFLLRMQHVLNKVLKGVGGFSHKEWRMFENRRSVSEAKNFIDGDLIESFLDLPKPQMAKVVELLNNDGHLEDKEPFTLEDLTNRIEELAQLH